MACATVLPPWVSKTLRVIFLVPEPHILIVRHSHAEQHRIVKCKNPQHEYNISIQSKKNNMRLVGYMSMTRAFTNQNSSFRVTFHRSGPGNFAVLFIAPRYGDGWLTGSGEEQRLQCQHKVELNYDLVDGFNPFQRYSSNWIMPPKDKNSTNVSTHHLVIHQPKIWTKLQGGHPRPYKPWIWSYKNPPFLRSLVNVSFVKKLS